MNDSPILIPLILGCFAIILLLVMSLCHDAQIKQLEAALKAYNIPLTPTQKP